MPTRSRNSSLRRSTVQILVGFALLTVACSGDSDSGSGTTTSAPDESVATTAPVVTVANPDPDALEALLAVDNPSPAPYIRCMAETVADRIEPQQFAAGNLTEAQASALTASAQTCFGSVYPTLDDDPAVEALVAGPRATFEGAAMFGDAAVDYSISLPENFTFVGSTQLEGDTWSAPDADPGAPVFAVQIQITDIKPEPLSLTQNWDELAGGQSDPEGLAWAVIDGITSVPVGAEAFTFRELDDGTFLTCWARMRGVAAPMTQGASAHAATLMEMCSTLDRA